MARASGRVAGRPRGSTRRAPHYSVRAKIADMPGKRVFDQQLAALETLRQEPAETAQKGLRKALAHRNNYIVGKAADLVRELHLSELIPDLLTAFDRFFIDPLKSDPQCWAKNAISKALSALEFQEPDIFLRGMRHIQLEPVWGGTSDTAGTLRGTCALALTECRSLPDHALLSHLLELFADKDKSVRVKAGRAVGQTGLPQAALLLRLRSVLAGDEPEVLGACFSGILSIEGRAAIPWLSSFMVAGDELAAEAALAIAEDRSPEAFQALHERFTGSTTLASRQPADDAWFQSALLSAIALTRQDTAYAFLLDLVRTQSAHSESAVEALLRSAPPPEIVQCLEQRAAEHPRLARALAASRSKP